ncbi:MAG: hypothetical protein AB7K52_09565 [Phycisphaerales bacterium]
MRHRRSHARFHELLAAGELDPVRLLDRLCEGAAATARSLGSIALFPDRHGLLTHELLTLAAARHGLSVGELTSLFPGAARAAGELVDALLAAIENDEPGDVRSTWGERPLVPGAARRHTRTRPAGGSPPFRRPAP